MKGPNPFAPYDEGGICGRKEEMKAFAGFLNSAGSKQAGALLICGGAGVGKGALLRNFYHEAEKERMLTLFISVQAGEDEKAVAGKAFAELMLRYPRKSARTPESFKMLLETIGPSGHEHFGVLIMIDDIDKMRKADEALQKIIAALEAGWGKADIALVMSSTRAFSMRSDILKRMEIKKFDEHDARELMGKALGKGPPKMGDECLNSILADTGGNPRLLKMVCFGIYDRLREGEKVISKGHYLAYLPQIMSTISREWFGKLYQETPLSERAILQVMARSDEIHVSDIAKKLGKPLGPITALTRRLLDGGTIEKVDRGRYRIFSKLYGRYVIQRG